MIKTSEQPPQAEKTQDSVYLEIWKIEQEHTRTRWTVTTFFFGVSFAIFGFSFQEQVTAATVASHIQRIAGVAVYWFAFLLFLQFNKYTKCLREHLHQMEDSKQVTFDLQCQATRVMHSRFGRLFLAPWLLFYFGLLYTLGVILLIVFRV